MNYHSHMALEEDQDYRVRPLRDTEGDDTLPYVKINVCHIPRLMVNTWFENRAGVGGDSGSHSKAMFVCGPYNEDTIHKTLIVLSLDRAQWTINVEKGHHCIIDKRIKANLPHDNTYSMGIIKKEVIDKHNRKSALFLKL